MSTRLREIGPQATIFEVCGALQRNKSATQKCPSRAKLVACELVAALIEMPMFQPLEQELIP